MSFQLQFMKTRLCLIPMFLSIVAGCSSSSPVGAPPRTTDLAQTNRSVDTSFNGESSIGKECGQASLNGKIGAIYIVRHAEKKMNGNNPPLTLLGKLQAANLRDRLSDVTLNAIYSTETMRTMATAKPTADAAKLKILDYPYPYDAERIKTWKKHLTKEESILIVGHLETVPRIVRELTDCRIKIVRYGQLFIVTKGVKKERKLTSKRYWSPK